MEGQIIKGVNDQGHLEMVNLQELLLEVEKECEKVNFDDFNTMLVKGIVVTALDKMSLLYKEAIP